MAAITILSAYRGTHSPSAKPSNLGGFIDAWLAGAHFLIVACLSVVALVARILQKVLNSLPKAKLKASLDALRDSFFAEASEKERHHNRVTLFRPDRRRKALQPHCRSGTQYQHTNCSFTIDDNDEQANEGVAGRAWFSDATISVELPAPFDPWDDGHENCVAYADAGFLPPSKAAGLKIKSRSILATPVRDSTGARWGILVVDSRASGGVPAERQGLVLMMATAIGKMI